jgi:hypothetical protein
LDVSGAAVSLLTTSWLLVSRLERIGERHVRATAHR